MSIPIITSIGLSFLLVIVIYCVLWRLSYRLNLPVSLQIVVASVAAGFGIGFIVLPATWFIFSYAFHPGGIETNLCPGSSVDNLVAALVVGILSMFIYAVHGAFRLVGRE